MERGLGGLLDGLPLYGEGQYGKKIKMQNDGFKVFKTRVDYSKHEV